MSNPRVTRKRDMQQGVVYNAVKNDGNNDDKWRPTVYKNIHRMQKVRVAQYEPGKKVISFNILRSKSGQGANPMDRPVILEGSFTRKCQLSRM